MSTSPKSGLDKVAAAFAAAEEQLGLGEPSVDLETPNPVSEILEPAEETPIVEQSDNEANEQVPTKLSDLDIVEDKPSAPSVTDDTLVEVPGVGELTLQELRESYLRRKDYTQKTQEVADQRREIEELKAEYGKAVELFEMLKNDTQGTIAKLAFEAGLIDQQELAAVGSKAPDGLLASVNDTEEKIAQIVQERIQEILGNDPAIQEFHNNKRVAELNANLDRLGSTYGVTLDDADKIAIANRMVALQEPNAELVFLRMQRELEDAKAEKMRVREAAGIRKSTPVPSKHNVKANSVREAWSLAEQSLAKGG